MSWVCTNCSTINEESEICCSVCGTSCPTSKRRVEGGAEDLKVVFSDFDAFKESVKSLFAKPPSRKHRFEPRADGFNPKKNKKAPLVDIGRDERPKKPRKPLFGPAFAAPWPEHKVKFEKSVIESKGYVKSERETLFGVNGYRFYKADGTSQFMRIEIVIIQKMAIKV